MYEERLAALLMSTRALIQANGGQVHSVAQLANLVTKSSRFVFEQGRRYLEQGEREGLLDLEATALVTLCHEYVKPRKSTTDFGRKKPSPTKFWNGKGEMPKEVERVIAEGNCTVHDDGSVNY